MPIVISVSVTPGPYFLAARAGSAVAASAPGTAVRIVRRVRRVIWKLPGLLPFVSCLDQRLVVPDIAERERDDRSMISRRAKCQPDMRVGVWPRWQAECHHRGKLQVSLRPDLPIGAEAAVVSYNHMRQRFRPVWVRNVKTRWLGSRHEYRLGPIRLPVPQGADAVKQRAASLKTVFRPIAYRLAASQAPFMAGFHVQDRRDSAFEPQKRPQAGFSGDIHAIFFAMQTGTPCS